MNAGASERSRVLINLCWLVPGVVGGSEEAVTSALRAAVDLAPSDVELHLAVLKPFVAAHRDLVTALPVKVLDADGSNKVRRIAAEQAWLARTAVRLRADVVHHAGGVVPFVHPGRVVVTIHDLQPLDLPWNFSFAKRAYMRTMLGRSAKAAEVVCVPSRFTASRVVESLQVPASKVVEVPWSVSAVTPPVRRQPLPRALTSRRFVLYPAITYPHKRHRLLLDAFTQVASRRDDVDLVLTGGQGPLHGDVAARIATPELADRVHHLGRVAVEDLENLYANASCVAITSEYEGFGLPALEAMSRGCPVVAAAKGSLPEVVPSTSLVDSDDPHNWAGAIESVLDMTDAQRAARIEEGLDAAAMFTPERTAGALLDAYRRAAAATACG